MGDAMWLCCRRAPILFLYSAILFRVSRCAFRANLYTLWRRQLAYRLLELPTFANAFISSFVLLHNSSCTTLCRWDGTDKRRAQLFRHLGSHPMVPCFLLCTCSYVTCAFASNAWHTCNQC